MSQTPYLDPSRPVEARVKDLLGRMNLDEKLAQLGCRRASDLLDARGLDPVRAEALLTHGIGRVSGIGQAAGIVDDAGEGGVAAGSARLANAIQSFLMERMRVPIPAILQEEALAGYCGGGATQYPQGIGLAATWAPESVRAMAQAVRAEMRALGVHQALAPVLDIARDPRWGRLEETYGEDPYLASRMGVAYVRGLQGSDPAEGVIATGRHFLGGGLAEGGMNQATVQLGPRELREVFAEPFSAAIREANLQSVMTSSSALDGVPPAASAELIDTLLRSELGFEGVVLGDDEGVDLLVRHHGVARDKGAAAALALGAGVDVELPELDCYGEPLKALLESDKVESSLMDRVDGAVRRILKTKFDLGLFERHCVDADGAADVVGTPESAALAARLAEQSLVLLKNDGTLPLPRGCRLALIGPAADSARLLLGDLHFAVRTERLDPLGAKRGHIETPREALTAFADVHYMAGCHLAGSDTSEFDSAAQAAREADVAVVCLGGKSGALPDCTSGEFRDASDLRLTGPQRGLMEAVAATGTPVVLVLIGGRAFALDRENEVCNAVLTAWLPGQEGAGALARTLFGEVNPAGRLPVSLPRSVGQVPVYHNHRAGGGRSRVLGDYTDGSTRALFPFGHGLSYAAFEYLDLACPAAVDVHATINLWVTIENTSERDGEEVVQVYFHDKLADVARPTRRLTGFKRVMVPAGERRRLKFMVDVSQLGYFDREMRFAVDPGEVEVMVGASSRDIRLRGTVTLQGARRPLQQQQIVATQVDVVDEEPKT